MPHFFSLMRQIRGYSYDDVFDMRATGAQDGTTNDAATNVTASVSVGTANSARTLFWPGCALSSYSRELTEAVFGFLRERDVVDGLSVGCCGNIIRFAADQATCTAYRSNLLFALEAQGIRRIVTACPNCYYSFGETLKDSTSIELIALSQFLVDEGLRIPRERIAPATSVCVHDSCPDRRNGVDACAVRGLLREIEIREMKHNRIHSRCCGLGQLRFVSDPMNSQRLREERIEEFGATGAGQLVTCCFSCANAFQDPATGLTALHYLELLFDIRVDWQAVYESSARALAAF